MVERKKFSKKNELNWFTITRKYWKDQLIFYILTTLSCLGAFVIASNAWKKLLGNKNEFIFEGKFFGIEFWAREIKSQGKFLTIMIIAVIIACLTVIAHVFFSYYFANKVTRAVKKKITHKLFSLQNTQDRKKTLSVLTHNARTFSYLSIFVPNQIYYALLDTFLVFYAVWEVARKNNDKTLIFWGVVYYFVILAVIVFFQYLVYRKDQPFQKSLKQETGQEEFLVNNRDLIIKKNLTSSSLTSYHHYLEHSRKIANKRDLTYTLAFVVPNYSLVRLAGFIFAPYGKDRDTKEAVINLIGLTDSTKKMIERLRDYPYGLSAQKQINSFLALPERNDIQKNIFVNEPVKSITLKGVSFAYQKGKPVLKKMDWEFKKGKINYLTGENGSGKSTIISLIIGLYQPDKGEVVINNEYKLNEVNLIKWREKIAYAEHENLIENGLSTGQKQLVDLKSIFANSENKEVFIFDEADNALDENNKKEFRQRVEKISKKKLVILISH